MQWKGSLSWSQELALVTHLSHTNLVHIDKTYFSMIVASMPRFNKFSSVQVLLLKCCRELCNLFLTITMRPCLTRLTLHSTPLYLVQSKNYEAPHYAVFFSLLFYRPSQFQIFSSAPCSQTLSICVLLLGWETKSHIHTKHGVKLQICAF
jgi:hypothetical protein